MVESLRAHSPTHPGRIVQDQPGAPYQLRSLETPQHTYLAGLFLVLARLASSFSGCLHSVLTSPSALIATIGVRLINACAAAWMLPAGWRFLRTRISRAERGMSIQMPWEERMKGGEEMSTASRMLFCEGLAGMEDYWRKDARDGRF